MPKVRTMALREGGDATTSPVLPDNENRRIAAEEGELLERYISAWQAANLDGFVALLREDATYHMPPWRDWYQGRQAIHGFFKTVWSNYAGYRAVATRANGQPVVALYARRHQEQEWRAQSLHVVEPADGAIAALTIYVAPLGPDLFAAFGLPPVLSGPEA